MQLALPLKNRISSIYMTKFIHVQVEGKMGNFQFNYIGIIAIKVVKQGRSPTPADILVAI